ncbi:MAG: DEAD/DEAH box helicase [Chitinophagales bacterium]
MSTFDQLGLSSSVMDAIRELGFVTPTPIQQNTIPMLLQEGTDLVALAQTGTGKTAAFGLPLIELVDHKKHYVQALILAPTRELCVQICKDLQAFSKYTGDLHVVPVYGGSSMRDQIHALKKGAQIVVATPGRLMDLMQKKIADLSKVRYVILDEADEMLNMGFQEDIDVILADTPSGKNTWLFSATMDAEIRAIASKYMHKPKEFSAGKANTSNVNIAHHYYLVNAKNKYAALKRILDFEPDMYGIIFCRTKSETAEISAQLMQDGYDADCLHGDLSQQQRDRVMQSFRSRNLQILVATDVAARGIDVDDLTHILHLHLPDDINYYTHRSGRTARAGRSGISLVLVTPRDLFKIKQLEKKISARFIHMQVPTGMEVCEKQLLSLMRRVHEVDVQEDAIAPHLQTLRNTFSDMDKEEVIKRFASLEFNRFLDYYRFAEDLNVQAEKKEMQRAGKKGNMAQFFINLGKMDQLSPKGLMDMISEVSGIPHNQFGDVRLKGAYSFFEVPDAMTGRVRESFRRIHYRGRNIRVELQNEQEAFPRKKGHKGRSKDMHKPKKRHN